MIQYVLFIISLCCFIFSYFINKKKKPLILSLDIRSLELLKNRNYVVTTIAKNINLLGVTTLAYALIYHGSTSYSFIGLSTFIVIIIYCLYNVVKLYKSIKI